MPTLDSILTNHFVPLLPRRWHLPFNFRKYCLAASAEKELIHLEKIPTQFRVAVDVGANQGLYSYKMSRHFRDVYAFEINSDLTVDLRAYAAPNVRVFDQGLSSTEGAATLYIPVLENGLYLTGWASLSREHLMSEVRSINGKVQIAEKPVQIKRLDDFALREVDFIKIDVEGHEVEVLRGAQETLRANHPHLLIETKELLPEVDVLLAGLHYRRISSQDLVHQRESPDLYLYGPRIEDGKAMPHAC